MDLICDDVFKNLSSDAPKRTTSRSLLSLNFHPFVCNLASLGLQIVLQSTNINYICLL